MTTPWMALVPLMSGVCSVVGTLEMTSTPTNAASTNTVSSSSRRLVHAATVCSSREVTRPSWVMTASAVISSSRSIFELAVGDEVVEHGRQVAGVHLAGVQRHPRGQVERADDGHALAHDRLARLGQLAVAAGLGGQVDDHRARPHGLDGGGRDQPRRRPAGHERGGDDDVGVGDVALEQALLLRLLLGRERGGVAARVLRRRRPPARARRSAAPRLCTCSLTTGRVSNADTTAPRRRAVAIACSPATPAPRTSTLAGATVPAAVISMGKNWGSASAARITDR